MFLGQFITYVSWIEVYTLSRETKLMCLCFGHSLHQCLECIYWVQRLNGFVCISGHNLHWCLECIQSSETELLCCVFGHNLHQCLGLTRMTTSAQLQTSLSRMYTMRSETKLLCLCFWTQFTPVSTVEIYTLSWETKLYVSMFLDTIYISA